jgi:RNA polymerase sigma factor (TIGR02999 family)
MSSESVAITDLIAQVRHGSADATAEIVTRLYDRFKLVASRQLKGERADFSLSTTDLAHGTVARLLKSEEIAKAADKNQLFRAFARAMRQLIIDHVRKRPPGRREELDDLADHVRDVSQLDVLALHEALADLALTRRRAAAIVELRYFGGYDVNQIPEVLLRDQPQVLEDGAPISLSTVERELSYGTAKLKRYLTRGRP